MVISTSEKKGISILTIKGEIELYNVRNISETLEGLIEKDKCKIIVNFEKVSYIDSTGIGALMAAVRKLKEKGGGINFIHVPASIKKVFRMTHFDTYFSQYNSEEEALQAFLDQ